MPRKLKVFRMPIGFEDAYVAAPSRKAALEAWGATHDQFARGNAEEVTDAELIREPLAHPGEVIRLSRGDLASQLAALPKQPKEKTAPQPKPVKPKPQPKRDKLDAAEAALKDAEARHAAEQARVEAQLETLLAQHAQQATKLRAKRDQERDAYRAKLAEWTG